MQCTIFTKFENQLKAIGKKYKFDTDRFFKTLCHEISNNPREHAVIITETESYQILKRRVANPKIRKGKSQGFRVWYCMKDNEICFCLIEDTAEKDKEKSTQQHIARIHEVMKDKFKELI
ncbi:MAG: hypothetical protein GY795_00975 [Desulfobacterales bacterium]|nr:hypothetical protein [Desulfobacterales bacterium]